MSDYQKKIDFAIKLLRAIPQDGEIELAYSGGKDSDVILQLAKEAGIPFRAIYKNTTIDPPYTIAHVKEKGVEIRNPKISFFDLVKKKGLPNRHRRFCCEYLKEYKILDRVIIGVRRDESNSRAARYSEPEVCRVYSKTIKIRQYLPILYWDKNDVKRFIKEREIKCHPLYYDDSGDFHVERRLGCIGCPLSKNRINELKTYPKFLKRLVESLEEYIVTHPNNSASVEYKTSYNMLFQSLFCNNKNEYQRLINGGMFPDTAINAKQFLEDYFKIDLTI